MSQEKYKVNGSYRLTATNTHESPMHQPAEKAESPASGIAPRRKKILLWSAVAVGFCVLVGLLCTLVYRDDLLMHYAGKNDVSMTRLMLTLGAASETKTKNGSTPLILAASKGHEDVVRLLLEEGADIEAKNKYGNTPLILAASRDREDVVRLLLERGAQVCTKNNQGLTAYDRANTASLKDLLEKTALRKIIAEQLHTNTPDALLLESAKEGKDKIAEILIDERGANPETKDKMGNTPLILAAYEGHEAVVRLLLEKGANIEAKNKLHNTPLILAAWEGHEAAVRLLLEKGANIEATQNETGNTPLIWAAAKGRESVVQLLLDEGADIEAKDNYGSTPLIRAAGNGHEAVVRLLLAEGADVEAEDNTGHTAYEGIGVRDSIKQLLHSYRRKK
ncbi:MAG: ankyrin repeat domain-containing protein [Akkermansia sp.]